MFEFLKRERKNSNNDTSVKNPVYWRNQRGEIACNGDDCMKQVCPTDCPIKLNTDGIQYLMFGQSETAIPYFKRAAEIAPDFPDAWNNMGTCYGNMGKHSDALEMFTKAYSIGHKKNALFGMIIANKSLGNRETALKLCEEYEQKYPDGQCEEIKKQLS